MDIRELKYIQAVGRLHNMTKAADSLFISQPALFKTVKKVESELDSPLFFKQGNELLPTDIGKVVLQYADEIENIMNKMQDEIYNVQNMKSGKVTIGFPSVVGTLYLPQPLSDFCKKYPEIELKTLEKGGSALRKEVENGNLDMAIVMRHIQAPSLNELPIVNDVITVSVTRDHPLAKRPFVTAADLKDVPFITFDASFDIHQYILDRFHSEGIRPVTAFTGASCGFMYRMAKASSYPLILPRPMIRNYDDGSYVDIPLSPILPWGLCLIYRKNEYLSVAAKTLMLFLQTYFLNAENTL